MQEHLFPELARGSAVASRVARRPRGGCWPDLSDDELGRLSPEEVDRFRRYEYPGCTRVLWRRPSECERSAWEARLDAEGWPPRMTDEEWRSRERAAVEEAVRAARWY